MPKRKAPTTRKVARSAVTGRFRTIASARRYPRTSVIETVRTAQRRRPR